MHLFMYDCICSCMCVRTYVCIYACKSAYMNGCLFVCQFERTYVCKHVCMHICINVSLYVFMDVRIYASTLQCMYVYMCARNVHMHIHTCASIHACHRTTSVNRHAHIPQRQQSANIGSRSHPYMCIYARTCIHTSKCAYMPPRPQSIQDLYRHIYTYLHTYVRMHIHTNIQKIQTDIHKNARTHTY